MAQTSIEKMDPVHPGEILYTEFMEPLGLNATQLSEALGITNRSRVNEIVKGERGITAETADLLSQFFSTTARFWLNLQAQYDLEVTRLNSDRLQVRYKMARIGDEPWIYKLDVKGRIVEKRKASPDKGLRVFDDKPPKKNKRHA